MNPEAQSFMQDLVADGSPVREWISGTGTAYIVRGKGVLFDAGGDWFYLTEGNWKGIAEAFDNDHPAEARHELRVVTF